MTTTIHPTLSAAIVAIDRLNSFVRSKSCADYDYGALRHFVYHLKTEALVAASQELPLTNRLIQCHVTCRICKGSGWFRPPTEHRGGIGCRTCNGDGHLFLRFVETSIPLPQPEVGSSDPTLTWHTPQNRWPLAPVAGEPGPAANGWWPNQAGRDLSPTEVAMCLVAAEQRFPRRPPDRCLDDFERGGPSEIVNDADYTLYLGATPEGVCSLCRQPAVTLVRYGVIRGKVRWHARTCEPCIRHFDLLRRAGMPGNIFNAFELPRSLFDNYAVAAWINWQTTKPTIPYRQQPIKEPPF